MLDNFNMKRFYCFGFILFLITTMVNLILFFKLFNEASFLVNLGKAASLGLNILFTVLFYWLFNNERKADSLGLGRELTKEELNKYFEDS